MVHFVTHENRDRFAGLIRQMHQQRRQIFVDELGWDVDVQDGLEIDEFDTPDAIYLLDEYEEGGALRGSARLLPSTGPHLMSDVFSHLCDNGVPSDNKTWEISRVCPDPKLSGGRERRPVIRKAVCAAMEAGLTFGWQRLTLQVGLDSLPFCLRCGWDVTPLGLPKYNDKNEILAAFAAKITPTGLQAVRRSAGVTSSVLEIPPGTVLNAA